jgi:NADH-quinone oxidoreductase subunit H
MTRALIATAVLLLAFPVVVLYLSLVERKILADMQARLGPMRVGPNGMLQALADALKLLIKENVTPSQADPVLFAAAPIVATVATLVAVALVPFGPAAWVADVNVGLLVIVGAASFSVLGLILGGWASNSHYPLLGAMRSAAQLISYEIALGFALVCAVLSAGTLSLRGIVEAQAARHIWFAFDHWGLMLPVFALYFVAAIAEANRAPFDLPEAESELAGGYHLEYSGMRFAFFMLAEYGNLVVACAVGATLFWGGWLRPFPNVFWLDAPVGYGVPVLVFAAMAWGLVRLARAPELPIYRALLWGLAAFALLAAAAFTVPVINQALSGLFWFALKVGTMLYVAFWIRATLPRFRYDQLMRFGWTRLIPFGMACLVANAIVGLVTI